jgi:hypothetical protein
MVARSLNANLLTRTSHLLTRTSHLLTRTSRQTILTILAAEAAEAEAAEAEVEVEVQTHQGLHDPNHHANQPKYPFLESQDRRNALRTEQLLRILPPMDSQ